MRKKSVRVTHCCVLTVFILCLLQLVLHVKVNAFCPTNGNTHAIYMTSNMGNNIWSFDTHGNYIGDVINVDSFPEDVQVHKLRAMRYGPGGYLYVLSASGSYSRIFALSGDGIVNKSMEHECQRNYLFTVVKQDKVNTILDHPYDMVFHPETHDLFVANQNSITVTKYKYDGMVTADTNSELELSPTLLQESSSSSTSSKGKHVKYPHWTPIVNNPNALPASKSNSIADNDDDENYVFVGSSERNGSSNITTTKNSFYSYTAAKQDKHSKNDDENENDDDDSSNKEITSDSSDTVKMPNMADSAGLFISPWSNKYFLGSVRGIALSPLLPRALVDGSAPPGLFSIDNSSLAYYLLVCDVATNAVRVFNPDTGSFMFSIYVPSPIQVLFPSRYYKHGESTVTANGAIARAFDTPHIYVTSKEDGMAYLVRFSSRTPPLSSGARTTGVTGSRTILDGDENRYSAANNNEHMTRLYAITKSVPLHGASGLYEYPQRDVLLIADRNGRKVSSYASPFLSDYTHETGPAPFLGYFLKQLPDQPEFLMSTLLESQVNIPFCYELNADGSFHYVALCTAAYIWSFVLAAIILIVPCLLLYRQVQHWRRVQRRQARLRKKNDDVFEPLLSNAQNDTNKYGTYA